MNNNRTAQQVLDAEFLVLRAKVLEIAASMDRVDRAATSQLDELKIQTLNAAIETLLRPGPNRAEQIQILFSNAYDDKWRQTMDI